MPRKGTEERGVADSQLHMLIRISAKQRFCWSCWSAKKLVSPSNLEKGIVQGPQQGNHRADRDTKELTEAESLERIRGNVAWREAREKICFHDVCTPLEENDRNKEANR